MTGRTIPGFARAALAGLLLGASTARAQEPWTGEIRAWTGAKVTGHGSVTIIARNGEIESIAPGPAPEGATITDASGQCITPGFIDSHVHLALRPESEAMASGGVVAAIDMGSTLDFLANPPTELLVWSTGPMMTAFGGYPVNSWGKNGYGREVLGPADGAAAVGQLIDAGAMLIKVPFAKGARLTDRELKSVVDAAHDRGRKVVAHALTDDAAARAAEYGCDVLAHVPNEPLQASTIEAWRGRAVISTLKAFGGSDVALDNLRRLREVDVTVLYGTDFGNSKDAGIDPEEIALMKKAGMSTAEVLASATSVPAEFWGMKEYGAIAKGKKAAFWVGPCDCAWCD